MSENRGQFALTGLLKRLPLDVRLAAEVGELGHRLEEVVIGVDLVAQREAIIKVSLVKERLDELNIGVSQVVVLNRAINCEWRLETPVDRWVIRVGHSILYSNLILVIVPVIARPEAVINDCRARHLAKVCQGGRENDSSCSVFVHFRASQF